MNSILSSPHKLAGNPSNDPKFAVSLKFKGQQVVQAACPKASRAMISLMDMNAVIGGAASHYGGPAAFAEIISALHAYVFTVSKQKGKHWYELFNIINDAGHCENGLYALKANYGFADLTLEKLKGFRAIDSFLTGHGESHLFPEGVFLSNGPLGSAFPQSQGLAMADALLGKESEFEYLKKRVTITTISDGACMEGEARESMAAIPGFAQSGKMAPFVLIISDNNTKLSGRIDKECFSMEPTFRSLATLGWKVLQLEDGHDHQRCLDVITQAIEEAQEHPEQPIAIHAKTIKGIGTKKTAESSSGGHGFPLKSATELPAFISEIYEGVEFPSDFKIWIEELIELEKKGKTKELASTEKIQIGVSNAMIQARKAGLPVVSITADLAGSTGTAGFKKEFPQFSFDVGVAESNMVSIAAGFSKQGFIPVVDTFAQFGVTKGALPLTMAILSQAPIICIYSHTGFQDAADGASHQALSYLAMTSSIPHVEVYCLTCSDEAQALMSQAFEKFAAARASGHDTPDHDMKSYVFFLGRENFPKNYGSHSYKLGQGQIISDNSSQFSKAVTLVGGGSCLPEVLKASQKLAEKGIGSVVLNPSIINIPDVATLKVALTKTKGKLVSVEDHQEIGGQAQMLAATLHKNGIPFSMKTLAVQGDFGRSAYNAIDLYRKHHLDAESILREALDLVQNVKLILRGP